MRRNSFWFAGAILILAAITGCGSTTAGGGSNPPTSATESLPSLALPTTTAITSSSHAVVPKTSHASPPATTHAAPVVHTTAASHPRTTTSTHHTTMPPPHTSTAAASCHPLTNSGNCYEPGEYCRNADHGVVGLAGDGKTIKCEDNNGWRWEPI